ncbi:MAG: hypothetical protein F6K30_09240 [Cyanothece sp. SIO2G6]|nr:hypothetical protein [Cyanothece sp. SIO2G6]
MTVTNPRLATQPSRLQPAYKVRLTPHAPVSSKVTADLAEHPIEALFGVLIMVGLLGFYGISTFTATMPFTQSSVVDSQVLMENQQ